MTTPRSNSPTVGETAAEEAGASGVAILVRVTCLHEGTSLEMRDQYIQRARDANCHVYFIHATFPTFSFRTPVGVGNPLSELKDEFAFVDELPIQEARIETEGEPAPAQQG